MDAIHIYSNTLREHCWGINVASETTDGVATDVQIYDNDIAEFDSWSYPSAYHKDGIIVWSGRGAVAAFEPKIYNNYIHGDLALANVTAYIFCTYGANGEVTAAPTACKIYNNLLVNDGNHYVPAILIRDYVGHNEIYNNTIIGLKNTAGTAISVGHPNSTITVKNNIVAHWRLGINCNGGLASERVAASDNNVFYNINTGPAGASMFSDGSGWLTWANWQDLGFDLNSYYENPNLTASYHLQSNSGNAIDHGATLDAAYNTDKDGDARTEPWSIGAYEYRLVPNISNLGSGAITITPNNAGAIAVTPY